MTNELFERLRIWQSEADSRRISLKKLYRLKKSTKAYFDQRIKELAESRGLTRRIKVPQVKVELWSYRGKKISLSINWRYILSIPFIYGMIFPAMIWHAGLEIYHQICFRLYGIPRVKGKDYFIYDRKLLTKLNYWEKINCIYCSYVNNLIGYSGEIGGRTERYWCPIKYYRRVKNAHSQYNKFIDTKDTGEMHQKWDDLRKFEDLT